MNLPFGYNMPSITFSGLEAQAVVTALGEVPAKYGTQKVIDLINAKFSAAQQEYQQMASVAQDTESKEEVGNDNAPSNSENEKPKGNTKASQQK